MMEGYLRKSEVREATAMNDDDLPLTKREREILQYIADGLNNLQIAEKLFISARTVETHRTNIMQKLDIHDAANLVRFALSKKGKHHSNPS
jgi:DNA-binding NarL/FixJ family response regulator